MKVLISNNFKAMRQGEFATASEEVGEFILNTEDCDFSAATLMEIASANKIKLKKEKKELMVSNLEAELIKLKLPEISKMSNTEKVKQIVISGFEAEKTDDEMLVEIVQSGISFRQATKMFRTCVEDNGLRISAKKRYDSILEILESNEFSADTFEQVQAMAQRISVGDQENGLEPVGDTSVHQATKAIRKYCKDLEIEFPKAPRKPKGGLRSRYLGFAASNPLVTDAELEQWYIENTNEKSSEDITKWMNRYNPTINHGRAVAAKAIETGEVAPLSNV